MACCLDERQMGLRPARSCRGALALALVSMALALPGAAFAHDEPSRKFTPLRVRAFLDHMTAQTQALLSAMEAGAPPPGPDGP